MAMICFEPTIPIKNAELYEAVGRITIDEMAKESFTYLGREADNHMIRLKKEHSPDTVCCIFRDEYLFPVSITEGNCIEENIKGLSRLLKFDLQEIPQEATV